MARFRMRGYKRSYGKKMRIRKYKKMRVFKNEKRKLGLQGNLIYGGLPERKKMYMSSIQEMTFTDSSKIKRLELDPTQCDEWLTLYTSKFGYNWDKFCISRIYIKIIPQYNTYSAGGNKTVPNFRAFYLINQVTDAEGAKLFATKQCINFEGGKTFTVLIDKPSFTTDASAVVYKYGSYLSLEGCKASATVAKEINDLKMEEEKGKRKFERMSQPPVDDSEDIDDEYGATLQSVPASYGRFFVKCDDDIGKDANGKELSVSLRFKVFFKVHLKG